jgi:hypothetical protein
LWVKRSQQWHDDGGSEFKRFQWWDAVKHQPK